MPQDTTSETDLAPDTGSSQANLDFKGIAQRMQAVIAEARGWDPLLRRTNVSRRSVARLLAGQKIKKATLMELAADLRLPTSWLIEGRGDFDPAWLGADIVFEDSAGTKVYVQAKSSQNEKSSKSARSLFSTVDMDLLGSAIRGAISAVNAQGRGDNWRSIAQVTALLYDEAAQAQEDFTEP